MGSVTITVINNYRYIFMFLWSLIAFKSISINGYASLYILKDFANKIKIKKICFLMYPLLVYLAFNYGNEISRQNINDIVSPYYVIFNLLYMTVIAIFIFFKGGVKA